MAKKRRFSSLPPLQFGKPEKRNWLAVILFCLFLMVAGGAVFWMVMHAGRYRDLECRDTGGMGTITSWGSCHEAE